MNLRLEVRPIPVSLPSRWKLETQHSSGLLKDAHAELNGGYLFVDGSVRRQVEAQVERKRPDGRAVAQPHPGHRAEHEGAVEVRSRPEVARFGEDPEVKAVGDREPKLRLDEREQRAALARHLTTFVEDNARRRTAARPNQCRTRVSLHRVTRALILRDDTVLRKPSERIHSSQVEALGSNNLPTLHQIPNPSTADGEGQDDAVVDWNVAR